MCKNMSNGIKIGEYYGIIRIHGVLIFMDFVGTPYDDFSFSMNFKTIFIYFVTS